MKTKIKIGFLSAYVAISLTCFSQGNPASGEDQHVTTIASTNYSGGLFLNRLLMGKNYRNAWKATISVPVFRLSTSGMSVERAGGSKQTSSLYLRDSSNRQWVIRSVDKDVRKGLPGLLRHTPLRWYKQQLVSAAYPFAAAVVSDLAGALGIIAPQPMYYVVADEDDLGEHRGLFANRLVMLERVEPTPDNSGTIETDSLLQLIAKEGNRLNEKQFLKARLLDMVVGDWDRHAGQWRWGYVDSGTLKYWYPIPRDRDHALFYTAGFLPGLMKLSFEPHLVGFSKSTAKVKSLNRKAWTLDRMLLKNLDERTWHEVTSWLQTTLSDAVIDHAIGKLPSELAATDGAYFRDRLKSRRDDLLPNVLKYYEFLSDKKVTAITGVRQTAGVANE